ncbi:MAG: TatD family hydrolase [Sphaerochaetaceae bacterium]|nr:TatD family hydrolase [Sphaerochaetaceae bacterium]MDC7249749.1 TatD family hydrolase [Sphaerochaetaceae bacterium]
MFDFHRHFSKDKPLDTAFYCTSSINEWDQKAKYMSFGILANNFSIKVKDFEYLLSKKLEENPSFHVGEVGLDNRFNNLEEQILFFEKALLLSYKYNRIFTIHIVRENDLLINILKKNIKTLPKHIIYHGFNKSVELAKQLQKYNVVVSINPTCMKSKLINNIKELDKIGFLVESDWDNKTDENYREYFKTFSNDIKALEVNNFEVINNEFRTILENF